VKRDTNVELALVSAQQPEPALTQTDDSVELRAIGHLPHVALAELDRKTVGLGPASATKFGRGVDAHDSHAAAPELECVAAGPQPASSTRVPGLRSSASTRNSILLDRAGS